jgi:hypothetical protein
MTLLNHVRPVLYTTGHIGLRTVEPDGTLGPRIGEPHRPVLIAAQPLVALSLYRTAPRIQMALALFGRASGEVLEALEDYLAALDGKPRPGGGYGTKAGGRDRARILAGAQHWRA